MKLELTCVEEDGTDYLVTLKEPSGKIIQIWVPKEDAPDYANLVWDDTTPSG
jgi:hypothetical protein